MTTTLVMAAFIAAAAFLAGDLAVGTYTAARRIVRWLAGRWSA